MTRPSPRTLFLALSVLFLATPLSACKRPKATAPSADKKARPKPAPSPKATRATGTRIVAVGDVHGDLAATKRVLRLAGLIDGQDNWKGGETVLVQTGDILDRGDDEPEILALFWRLQQQAPKSGGRVELLLGNHEIMNAQGDLRYVTPGGFADYANTAIPAAWPRINEVAQGLPPGYLARKAAFIPGSPIAQHFADQKIAAVVGDTVFVHGGISPTHAKLGLNKMNTETQAWLDGKGPMPSMLKDADGPIWHRDFGLSPTSKDCAALERSLASLGVSRMVVGHTVQDKGINAACDARVWRIDVGMAAHYGGPVQALEIRGDQVRVISDSASG